MLRKSCKTIIPLLAVLFSQEVIAVNNHDLVAPVSGFFSMLASSYIVTLSGGQVWESDGQTQTLNLAPGIEKTYTANQPTNTLAVGELFLGIQRPLMQNLQGQAGFAFVMTGDATLSGNIWDDADPVFNNYTYKYNVKHSHVALKGKLLGDWGWPVMPWISGSVGVGINRASDFTNSPTIYEAVPNANFSSNTITSFTYTLGIGMQRLLTENWQAGIGYEFADWGKSQLGAAAGQTSENGLSLTHLYTNGVMLNLTYTA